MNKTATLLSKKQFVTVKTTNYLLCRSVEIGMQTYMSAMIQSDRRSRFYTAVMRLYHLVVAFQYGSKTTWQPCVGTAMSLIF